MIMQHALQNANIIYQNHIGNLMYYMWMWLSVKKSGRLMSVHLSLPWAAWVPLELVVLQASVLTSSPHWGPRPIQKNTFNKLYLNAKYITINHTNSFGTWCLSTLSSDSTSIPWSSSGGRTSAPTSSSSKPPITWAPPSGHQMTTIRQKQKRSVW